MDRLELAFPNISDLFVMANATTNVNKAKTLRTMIHRYQTLGLPEYISDFFGNLQLYYIWLRDRGYSDSSSLSVT